MTPPDQNHAPSWRELRDAALWSLLFASIVFGVAALASLAVAFALTPSLD